MTICDNCGGDGGFEIATGLLSHWGDPTPGGEWVDCVPCGGSGWIDEEPPLLGMDDLEERCGTELREAA